MPARWYEAPCFYFTNPHAYVGAFDDVERFPESWGRAGERVPPPLVPANVVTLEVEGLGTVRNRVVDPADPAGPARASPAARATKGSGRHAVPWALARASVIAFAPPCEVCPPSTGISAPLR